MTNSQVRSVLVVSAVSSLEQRSPIFEAPLNMHRLVVTYDNGEPDEIRVQQKIKKGGESGNPKSKMAAGILR
jgi:hypothetical protein